MPLTNPDEKREYMRLYKIKNKEILSIKAKIYRDYLRIDALTYYSTGDVPECTCCGELEIKFLAIDHIDGGGTIHRKELGSKYMMSWLRTNDYPDGFQTLCHNCNMAKGFYGICPHKEKLVLGEVNAGEPTRESQE